MITSSSSQVLRKDTDQLTRELKVLMEQVGTLCGEDLSLLRDEMQVQSKAFAKMEKRMKDQGGHDQARQNKVEKLEHEVKRLRQSTEGNDTRFRNWSNSIEDDMRKLQEDFVPLQDIKEDLASFVTKGDLPHMDELASLVQLRDSEARLVDAIEAHKEVIDTEIKSLQLHTHVQPDMELLEDRCTQLEMLTADVEAALRVIEDGAEQSIVANEQQDANIDLASLSESSMVGASHHTPGKLEKHAKVQNVVCDVASSQKERCRSILLGIIQANPGP